VGYDLTEATHKALLDGPMNFLISHPIETLAREAIVAMIRTFDGEQIFCLSPPVCHLTFLRQKISDDGIVARDHVNQRISTQN
jgi:hypothetical protein